MASVNQAAVNQAPAIENLPSMSSFIAGFEYDPAQLTLTTHMRSGAIYQHKMVLPMEWEALKTAQDHSRHWSRNIRGKKLSVRLKTAKSPTAKIRHKAQKI